jgi:hypothetical protein
MSHEVCQVAGMEAALGPVAAVLAVGAETEQEDRE